MNTQFDNAGDALIIRELINLISGRATPCIYLGRAPDAFVNMLELEKLSSVTVHRTRAYVGACVDMLSARARGECCYYFLTPGGLIGEKTVKQTVIETLRLAIMAVLALSGVKICQLGFSLEKVGNRHARLLRWRSKLLSVCAPRDSASVALARNLGIRTTGMSVDLSLNLFSLPRVGSRRSGVIALSFRIDKDELARARAMQFVEALCDTMDESCRIICVAQVGRDVPFMKEIYEHVSSLWSGNSDFIDCHESVGGAVEVYGMCEAVISNRLHVLLLALYAYASPVAWVNPDVDSKIFSVFEMLGISEFAVTAEQCVPGDVLKLLRPTGFDGAQWADELSDLFDRIFSITPLESLESA